MFRKLDCCWTLKLFFVGIAWGLCTLGRKAQKQTALLRFMCILKLTHTNFHSFFLFVYFKAGPSLCYSPKDEGLCSASVPRFYYNAKTKTCEKFAYTGCGGNNNNFLTQKSCLKVCKKGRLIPLIVMESYPHL